MFHVSADKNQPYVIVRKITHALAAVFIFLVICLGFKHFSPDSINYTILIIALVFMGLGGFLRMWALHEKGGNPGAALVRGPYVLCRHPRYLGSIFFISGAGLILFQPLFALVIIIVAMAVYQVMALKEESDCLRLYGKSYADYLASTSRWLPFYIFHNPHPTLRREIRRVVILIAAVLLIAGLRYYFYW